MRRKKKPSRSKSKGYLQYSTKSLRNAYTAVMESKMSMYQASKHYHVPYMTLHDRVKGRIPMGTPMGRRGMFNLAQEKVLVDYFRFLMGIGYGYSKCEFLQVVTDQAVYCGSKKKKGKVKVGKIWYYNFLKRHPDVFSVRPHQRPMCATKDAIHKYYSELQQFLKKHGLANKPYATFCMDKVHIACEEPQEKQKVQDLDEDSDLETSTVNSVVVVLAAANSAWNQLPPFFVFPGESKLPRITDATPGTSGSICSMSWVDGDVMMKYLFEHFLPLARSSGADDSLVLLYDGHKFPLFPGLMDWAQEKKLYLFPLPPHISCVQKSGLTIMEDFDDVYTQELQAVLRKEREIDISKNTTCKIACQAYLKVMSQEVLKEFFQKAGVIPFDPLATEWPSLKPLNLEKTDKKTKEEDVQSDSSLSDHSTDSVPEESSSKAKKTQRSKSKPRKRKSKTVPLKSSGSNRPKRARKVKTFSDNSDSDDSDEEGITKDSDSDLSKGPDFEDDEQTCCVCDKLEPPGLAGEVSTVIVEWVQCDACPHWTHLRFCTKLGVPDEGEEFKCPHCALADRPLV